MKRRDFMSLLGGAGAAWPLAARAQQGAIPTFGILLVFSPEAGRAFTDPIRAYMQALGYIEGRNILFDFRLADGKPDRLPALAADLAGHRPAVIATFGDAAGLAAKAATSTIPIVAMSEDLVRAKLVANMRQPAGNITGVSIMGTELDAKRLEGLAELLPARSTVLLLADPTTHRESRPALDSTAAARRLGLREALVATPDQIDRALREAKASGVAGVNVLASAVLFALRGRIMDLAAELGLPAMYQWPETADEGGLIAYGPSLRRAFRQLTTFVDKILRGTSPADLPVEQPTKFDLVINLKTAKALRLAIPPSLLLRADRVVE
ncbi:MAG TPA: ABC transporter substrate-binding protein [Candidatus Nitrosotalea sp.]|jgi:putative ABC transport system substrate-binding protein|nr:ABC transporter substrate-binding protein [Candidatus Nitrosotalea sp.]